MASPILLQDTDRERSLGWAHWRNVQEVEGRKSHLGTRRVFHRNLFVVEMTSGLIRAGASMYLSDDTHPCGFFHLRDRSSPVPGKDEKHRKDALPRPRPGPPLGNRGVPSSQGHPRVEKKLNKINLPLKL